MSLAAYFKQDDSVCESRYDTGTFYTIDKG
ncbi:hypothetical protein PsalN5692_02216 [Piscirickettsia salmonis]|nr:hypothetical protein PsalN5692_02216 [Piscirickettsia salmonis]QGP53994.1 hypothetical protein PsalSR1_01420 [Piscirickettsia salmonis]QGP60107.1 hypothetical protein PsalBI1_02710 [Piscirickettsia salmonis]QGP63570.1 hypothetical protein PsalMR5_01428 [Piscirickettsia salmonis]